MFRTHTIERLKKIFWVILLLLGSAGFLRPAHADLTIDITGVGSTQVAVSVSPFVGNDGLPEDLSAIIQNDRTLLSTGSNRSELRGYARQFALCEGEHSLRHIEKLANLEQLPATGYEIACFPFKIKGASAGFTRAVGIFGD